MHDAGSKLTSELSGIKHALFREFALSEWFPYSLTEHSYVPEFTLH